MSKKTPVFLIISLVISLVVCQPAHAQNSGMDTAKKAIAKILRRISDRLAPKEKRELKRGLKKSATPELETEPVKPLRKKTSQTKKRTATSPLDGSQYQPLGSRAISRGDFLHVEYDQKLKTFHYDDAMKVKRSYDQTNVDSLLFEVNDHRGNVITDAGVIPVLIVHKMPNYSWYQYPALNSQQRFRVVQEGSIYKVYENGGNSLKRIASEAATILTNHCRRALSPDLHGLIDAKAINDIKSKPESDLATKFAAAWIDQLTRLGYFGRSKISKLSATFSMAPEQKKLDPKDPICLALKVTGKFADEKSSESLELNGVIAVDQNTYRIKSIQFKSNHKHFKVESGKSVTDFDQTIEGLAVYKYMRKISD